jgi:DNA-binding NtrC family response regulator
MDCSIDKQNRILIIDDDESYCLLLKNALLRSAQNVRVDFVPSLEELGSVGHIRAYDLIILDYALEKMNGLEIAEYIDAFFPDKPAIIVSGVQYFEPESRGLPAAIKAFVPKSSGITAITNCVNHHLADRPPMLRPAHPMTTITPPHP